MLFKEKKVLEGLRESYLPLKENRRFFPFHENFAACFIAVLFLVQCSLGLSLSWSGLL